VQHFAIAPQRRYLPTCDLQPSPPRPSRLAPPAAAPAIAPAAGPGAAPLHPSTLLSHVQRATFNLHPLAPLASRLPPRPSRRIPARRIPSRRPRHCPRCRSGRSAAAPLHVVVPRSTCNVQPSPPRPSRLSPPASPLSPHPRAPHPLPPPPPPLPPLPVRAQRRCTPPRCCPTFNVQRSTFTPSPLSPLASRLAPLAASPRAASPPAAAPAIAPAAGPGAAPLHPSTLLSHVQRATFNLHPLAPPASRRSPLASPLSPLTSPLSLL
jgi:hypothetical protein